MNPTRTAAAQVRALAAINASLFAPQFRALENYASQRQPDPTAEDVRMALTATLKWQRDNEVKLACEVSERRKAGNAILLDDAVRALAFCRAEIVRITELRDALEAPQSVNAAE